MHMIFTQNEKKWINTNIMGWPIKEDCPKKIYESILKKKSIINSQNIRNKDGDILNKQKGFA